jgi:hypothetical protein
LLLLGGLLLGGGGDGLLLGGVGGGPPDVDGGVDGVLGFVGGDGLALASITDPSGHVLVVGDVNVGGGVNVCVHDGSVGFFVQSTGGGIDVLQLPAAHVDPVPFPPDAATVMLFVGRHVAL